MHRWAAGAALLLLASACTSSSDPTVGTTSTTLAAAATTAGSSSTTSEATTTTTESPDVKPVGGTVRYLTGLHTTLNPYLGGWNDGLPINANADLIDVFALAGVWRWNADTGEVEPDLIVEFPTRDNGGFTINGDGTLTVRYEIDAEATWSDGVQVSGDDFMFTYEAVVETAARLRSVADAGTPEVFTTCGFDEEVIIDGDIEDAYAAILPGSMTASPKTFEYTLSAPGDYTEDLFRWVLPRHAVAGSDFLRDWNDRLWPSAGPFMLESADFVDHTVVFVRNPNYWRTDPETGQRLPLLDRLVLDALDEEFIERMPDAMEIDHDFDADTDPVPVEGLHTFFQAGVDCLNFQVEVAGIDGEQAELYFLAMDEAFPAAEEATFIEGLHIDIPILFPDRIARLEAEGFETHHASTLVWDHIAFHFGDARLRANPESLIEHADFRRAIAHAIDRDRIAAETALVPGLRLDSIVGTVSPSLAEPWRQYEFDPDRAREMLNSLCSRLDRDCIDDPPRLVFTHAPFGFRLAIADLLTEMLGEVGIIVDTVPRDLGAMLDFTECQGWEASTFAWSFDTGFAGFAGMYVVFDPRRSAFPLADDLPNYYAWGTDSVDGLEDDPATEEDDGFVDDPDTADCDESTLYNQGPSSVRDEFTERFVNLVADAESLHPVLDLNSYLPLIQEMEDILAGQAIIIPLFIRPTAYAIRDDIVGGYGYAIDNFTGASTLWNVESWYLKQPQPGT